jgi:hypothetical protein
MQFKQLCNKCKKEYIPVRKKQRYVLCYSCQSTQLSKEIKDPKMKKLFDIPEEFYKENVFLRNIKVNFIRYESLTDNQINAFKKTVDEMKKEKTSTSKDSNKK